MMMPNLSLDTTNIKTIDADHSMTINHLAEEMVVKEVCVERNTTNPTMKCRKGEAMASSIWEVRNVVSTIPILVSQQLGREMET